MPKIKGFRRMHKHEGGSVKYKWREEGTAAFVKVTSLSNGKYAVTHDGGRITTVENLERARQTAVNFMREK